MLWIMENNREQLGGQIFCSTGGRNLNYLNSETKLMFKLAAI